MPLVGSAPVQPPLAVQEVALVLDQVSVELAPNAMVFGLAVSVTLSATAAVADDLLTWAFMQTVRLLNAKLKARAEAARDGITRMGSPAKDMVSKSCSIIHATGRKDSKRFKKVNCPRTWKAQERIGKGLVELSGIEPLASSLRTRRSPS